MIFVSDLLEFLHIVMVFGKKSTLYLFLVAHVLEDTPPSVVNGPDDSTDSVV